MIETRQVFKVCEVGKTSKTGKKYKFGAFGELIGTGIQRGVGGECESYDSVETNKMCKNYKFL